MDTTALLKKMTLRQKLSQLTQLDSSFFLKYGTSELTGPLHGMNIKEEDVACCGSVLGAIGADVTREIQEKHLAADPLKIPVLFMLDVIHGFRTIFPINLGLFLATALIFVILSYFLSNSIYLTLIFYAICKSIKKDHCPADLPSFGQQSSVF